MDDICITQHLNNWTVRKNKQSADKLRAWIFVHLKDFARNQLEKKKLKEPESISYLRSATTVLKEAILKHNPSKEIYNSREEFIHDFAGAVRWVILDEIKNKKAKKRSFSDDIAGFFPLPDNSEQYILLDSALERLKKLRERSYQIALLHYFLGYDIETICQEVNKKSSTVRAELATARAYIYTQLTL